MDKFNSNDNYDLYDNEIDLKKFFNIFIRGRVFIIATSLVFTLLSVLFSILVKPVYQGNFKLLIEDIENRNLDIKNNFSDAIAENFSLKDLKNNFTKIEILKSRKLLNPIYEETIKSFKNRDIKTNKLSFDKWKKKYFNLSSTKKTDVITVRYRDLDKDFIILTLNKIADKYKDYSRRDRKYFKR